jgi:UDP-N-acetylglucosamine 3-dehydrogenase
LKERNLMLKVGILGTGTMAKTHASAYQSIEGVQVAAFADALPGSLDTVCKQYNAKAYTNYDELINDASLDIIDVCLPTPLHKENTIKALATGKHVFCEKPVARTLADAMEVKKAVEQAKGKFMVGHVVRFFPEFMLIKQLIDEGKVGTVGTARTSRIAPQPHGVKDWYENATMSGGVVLDLIIHDFDYLNWFFGKPKRVYAQGLFKRTDLEMDYALVVIRYESGVIAHVEGSWAEPSGFNVRAEICGSKGILDVEPYKEAPVSINLRNATTAQAGVIVPESPMIESPYTTEIKHFVDCILNNQTPRVTVDDAIYALKIGLAALESIETGMPVNID